LNNKKGWVLDNAASGDTVEVYTHVLVEGQPTDAAQGVSLVRPSVRVVKNINWCRFDLFRLHYLNGHRPCGKVSLLDSIEKVLDVVVWFFSRQSQRGFRVQSFNSIVGLEVPFDVDIASILHSVRSTCVIAISYTGKQNSRLCSMYTCERQSH
jgi:hypothetical protein